MTQLKFSHQNSTRSCCLSNFFFSFSFKLCYLLYIRQGYTFHFQFFRKTRFMLYPVHFASLLSLSITRRQAVSKETRWTPDRAHYVAFFGKTLYTLRINEYRRIQFQGITLQWAINTPSCFKNRNNSSFTQFSVKALHV